MEFLEDPGLADEMIKGLAEELQQEEWQRKVPHLTELVYCLTKSWLNRKAPSLPSDREVLLFATGVGLEKVLLKKHRQHIQGECEGIHYDMDFLDYDARLGEFKSTRMSVKRPPEEFSEGWKRQIKGYLYAQAMGLYDSIAKSTGGEVTYMIPERHEATLGILHLMGGYAPPFPELRAWRLTATWEEIQGNWVWLQARKELYLGFLEQSTQPKPYQFCMEWECQYCRYSFFCKACKAVDEMEANLGQAQG